jgi:hypothetical protein
MTNSEKAACIGKVQHASFEAARLAATRSGKAALKPYRCQFCGLWHLSGEGRTHAAARRPHRNTVVAAPPVAAVQFVPVTQVSTAQQHEQVIQQIKALEVVLKQPLPERQRSTIGQQILALSLRRRDIGRLLKAERAHAKKQQHLERREQQRQLQQLEQYHADALKVEQQAQVEPAPLDEHYG